MGLFSSKKVTTVGTSVARVVDDKGIPNAAKTGLIKAIFQGGDIPSYVMEEMVGSVAVKAERMYEYASRDYTWGLPSGYAKDSVQGRPQLIEHLTNLEGGEISPLYLQFGPPNTTHIGWMKLIAEHGYNQSTNQLAALTAAKGYPVYLEDMELRVPLALVAQVDSGSIDRWGISPRAGTTPERKALAGELQGMIAFSPPTVDVSATDDYLRIHYTWLVPQTGSGDGDAGPQFMHEYFDMPITGYDENADYYHACYTVGDSPLRRYWIYRAGAGSIPGLDTVFEAPIEQGTFFPFAYFRFGKKSATEDKTTEDYKTSKKLVKYLDMDYDMVSEAIDSNPDIDDIEQAMMMMAVPAVTTNELERRYLFTFFENVFNAAGDQFNSRLDAESYAALFSTGNLVKNTMVIQDRRFKLAVSNAGIYKKRKVGVIAEVGKHSSSVETEYIPVEYQDGTDQGGGAIRISNVPITYHCYRRQRTTTIYDEIRVAGLSTTFYIFGKHATLADDEDSFLLIPLDRSITKDYEFRGREELYARSLHFVFNSLVVTKVKWYQSEWFQLVLIVAAIVITIVSMGGDGGQSLALALAAGEITLAAALNLIIIGVVKYVVTMLAVKLFVKVVGLEAAFVIAVLAAMAGVAMKYDLITVPGAPWAKDLLSVATNLASGVKSELGALVEDLADEASDFTKFSNEQTKLLDTANELLENQTLLSPMTIFGESPDEFYDRTVHSGNIGVIGISAIGNFVDYSLKLPNLNDSVGDAFYV